MDYKWLASSLIVIAGIAIGLWQYFEARRKQLLVDLQGDKNAVAAVAMRVRSGRFPRWSARHRRELFEALCVAAVFQRSGRSRSLIYGALANAGRTEEYHRANKFRQEIQDIVDRITVTVSRSSAYTDLARARRMLIDLRAALRLDNDVRIRLDTFELNAHTAEGHWPPDARLRHPAFSWADLEKVVNHLGSLVLVGPPEGSSPVIALDYHQVNRKLAGTSPERPVLTPVGKQVDAAKRKKPGDPTEPGAWLADQLATAINKHPAYSSASSLAAVPGRHHDFSDKLGTEVAKRANKKAVSLEARGDFFKHGPRFTVVHSSIAKGETVIVLDDVYRTGRTLQAAARGLLDAGAKEVLGLTATCTISAAALPCHGDSCTASQP